MAMPFEYGIDGCTFSGTLQKVSRNEVELISKIEGKTTHYCDRCGKSYDETLDIELKLQLSDIPISGNDSLDSVEFLDGMIDIDELLHSELESIKTTYNYCPECKDDNSTLEVEY